MTTAAACGLESVDSSLEADADNNSFYRSLDQFYRAYNPVHGQLSAFLCATGIVLNLANIVVLTRPSMLSSINHILTAVAVCDIGLMLSYLVFLGHFVLTDSHYCDPNTYSHGWAVFLLLHANFSVFTHTLSLYLTVAMALLRYLMVRQHHKTDLSAPSVGCGIIAFSTLLVLALCTPNFMTYWIQPVDGCLSSEVIRNESRSKVADVVSQPQTFYVNFATYPGSCVIQLLSFWIGGIVFKIVPCVILCIFMGLLIDVIISAAKRRRRLLREDGHALGQNDRTTVMLVLIVLVFLITEVPQGLLAVLSGLLGPVFFHRVYKSLGDILDLLSLLNSSVNFFLYCVMSRNFRQVFCHIFFRTDMVVSMQKTTRLSRLRDTRNREDLRPIAQQMEMANVQHQTVALLDQRLDQIGDSGDEMDFKPPLRLQNGYENLHFAPVNSTERPLVIHRPLRSV